jgi:enolase
MACIAGLSAREILDSRGNPTVEVDAVLDDGARGRAAVPSGASTGSAEALELRDGGQRYGGRGVLQAVAHVNETIAAALAGAPAIQEEVDRRLCQLDGTPQKGRLGANAILGVSLAVAHAAAASAGVPLWRHLGGDGAHLLPVPLMNVINGGRHADNPLDVQEFMIVPAGFDSFSDALRAGADVYRVLHGELRRRGLGTGVGDEGGFAPDLDRSESALELLVSAIEGAGYRAGGQVYLALDPAASELRRDGLYHVEGQALRAEELVERYAAWAKEFPLVSLEDGLGEDDREGWQALTARLGAGLQLVGDDVFVTDAARVRAGVRDGVANAVLIKPNQIGTLTETLAAVDAARGAGYRTVMSHRSGETPDATIAHLVVGWGCGQIKTGAPARGERVAKYNELLRIESELGAAARFAGRDAVLRKRD